MSGYFYGIGGLGSSFFDTMLGNSQTGGTSSLSSSLGDLRMIQSGAYKKALKAYYAKQSTADKNNTKTESGKEDTGTALSSLKSSSGKLSEAASVLKNVDFDKEVSDDTVKKVKDFVSGYNSTISSTKNMNSYSILQTAVWMKNQTASSETLLNKVGITVGDDNTLSVDEEKLKKADSADLKALFGSSSSYSDRIQIQASSLKTQAANQIALNSGQTLYGITGYLK